MKIDKKQAKKGGFDTGLALVGGSAGYAATKVIDGKARGAIPFALGLVISATSKKYEAAGLGMSTVGGMVLANDLLLTNADGTRKGGFIADMVPNLQGIESPRHFDEMTATPVYYPQIDAMPTDEGIEYITAQELDGVGEEAGEITNLYGSEEITNLY